MVIGIRKNILKAKGLSPLNPSSRHKLLFSGFLFSGRIKKKYPFLAALHRGIDGALIGVLLSAAVISGLALHSKYLWTLDFERLDVARDLNQRLEETTAVLERHFLHGVTLPYSMVATKPTDLLYIDRLKKTRISKKRNFSKVSFETLLNFPKRHGY